MPQVAVIDFGGQYAHLIARRVRDLGFSAEVYPWDSGADLRGFGGIILSGGPESVNDWGVTDFDFLNRPGKIPVLGICFGMQLIAQCMGGTVSPAAREFGSTTVYRKPSASVLMSGAFAEQPMWMSHRDSVTSLWEGARVLASTDQCPIVAFEDTKNKLYGVQFHPEVTHSTNGDRVLMGFLQGVCILKQDWSPTSIIDETVEWIRTRVGESKVLCALSGGVDSVVAAALTHRAIGDQLHCYYVDTGLMRFCDMEDVNSLSEHIDLNITTLHRQEHFLEKLAGVTDPEEKRKIVGREFIDVFQSQIVHIDFDLLLQGTIRSDVIESGGGYGAAVIKSHHNVGGLPDAMQMSLLEPLRGLYKDEVRKIGTALGLPDSIVHRQPFPGPGFAIRVLGEVTPDRVGLVRAADDIVRRGLRDFPLWQAFAVLLPVQSVGVQGDSRTYENTIVVRAVTSEDAMTADWADLPKSALESVSTRITNEVPGVNRVVYDITSKPPGTIEWE